MKNKTSKETINIDIEVRDDDVITMRQEQNTHTQKKGTFREKRDLLEINTIAKMKILKKRLGDKVAKIFRKNKDKYKDKKTR